MVDAKNDDKNFRRKFPRREFKRKIGVLCGGQYFLVDSGEIGEGGMSFISEYVLNEGDEVILSFQIPGGEFVSVRAVIMTTQKKDSAHLVIHGVSFNNIKFSNKRQIRSFVSDRNISNGLLN